MERIIYIDYARCAKQVLRKLPVALAIALAAGLVAATVCYFALDHDNRYEARSSCYTKTTNEYGNASEGVQYAEFAHSLAVAGKAAESLGEEGLTADAIYGMTRVEYDKSTPYVNSSAVIEIFAESRDPATAMRVANAVAKAFVNEVSSIARQDVAVELLDVATTYAQSYDAVRTLVLYTLLAVAGAFALACFGFALADILSLRLDTVQDGLLYGKLELIGVIPSFAPYQAAGADVKLLGGGNKDAPPRLRLGGGTE